MEHVRVAVGCATKTTAPDVFSPRGRHEHVVFVLDIECSKYVAIVDGSGDELLAGCRCAACGGSDLRVTGSRVFAPSTSVDRLIFATSLVLAVGYSIAMFGKRSVRRSSVQAIELRVEELFFAELRRRPARYPS